ncbi:PREDICTED: mis18-binding protein 1 [Lepidothrix coronata]|uniref:Mis18-binding protein 1 n=1 Tax=Lepidothrix coronata TaxID=321398 RepID=A0A6J0I4X1_9PASS|nr:PREDICTED: mis18-binding protein 1 [Lepidothrix coronata]
MFLFPRPRSFPCGCFAGSVFPRVPQAPPTAEPPVLETPQKFFLRIKEKLQQQQQHKDPTPSDPIQQNIPPSTATEKPLVRAACAEQPRAEPPKEVDTNKEDDVDIFLVEPIDDDGEMSQNTGTSFLNVNSTPSKNEDQVTEKWGNGGAKHTELHQDRRELQPSKKQAARGVEKTMESNSPKPSQCFCSIMLSSPTVHIPRKQKLTEKPKDPLDKPHTDQPAGKADKEKSICLSSWRIKVMEGNTAISLEGKRQDMKGLLWHSNAITERVAHNQLRTSSGSLYVLQGKIDSATMRREGFPYRFIKRFTFGFSRRWKEYVQEFLEERRRKDRKQNSGVDEESDTVVEGDVLETAEGSKKKPGMKNTTYEVLPRNDENTYTTPRHSSQGDDSSRVYTRSGRQVRPPMNFWCGQRAFVDRNLDVTLEEGGVDYLSLMLSSEKSHKKTSFLSKKNKPKEVMKTTEEMPKSQNKGKNFFFPIFNDCCPADKKELVISARVGTLKRKRQMREFLEHLPKDNHDDVFTTTPFQNRRVKLPPLRNDDPEDFSLGELSLSPSSAVFPLAKTPQCEHISPGMLAPINR